MVTQNKVTFRRFPWSVKRLKLCVLAFCLSSRIGLSRWAGNCSAKNLVLRRLSLRPVLELRNVQPASDELTKQKNSVMPNNGIGMDLLMLYLLPHVYFESRTWSSILCDPERKTYRFYDYLNINNVPESRYFTNRRFRNDWNWLISE